jgi:hypothetical protein
MKANTHDGSKECFEAHLRGVVARRGGGLDLHDAEGVQVEDGQHHQLDQHQRACGYTDG